MNDIDNISQKIERLISMIESPRALTYKKIPSWKSKEFVSVIDYCEFHNIIGDEFYYKNYTTRCLKYSVKHNLPYARILETKDRYGYGFKVGVLDYIFGIKTLFGI